MDELEGEGGDPPREPCPEGRTASTGNIFHGPAALVQGTGNTQINHFGGGPQDDREDQLTEYLAAALDVSKEHPYPAVLPRSRPSLDDVYVRQRLGNLAENGVPLEAGALERILTGERTCVVHAGAGGGKSSLLRTLLAMGAKRHLDSTEEGPVPVLVPAAAWEGRSLSEALALAVRLELKGLVRTLPPRLFEHAPKPGAYWLVLVDELDEIADPVRRRKVLLKLKAIENRQREPGYRKRREPRYRFVIATRPLPEGELKVLGSGVAHYELERFQLTDVEAVAHRWFGAHGLSDPRGQARVFVADLNRSRLAGLARIPLTASLLCQLRAAAPTAPLPGVRGEIYNEFARLLHERQYNPAEPGNPRELPAGFQRYNDAAVERAEHTLTRLPDLIDYLADQRRTGNPLSAVEIVWSHPDAEAPPYPVPRDVWREFLATALSHSGYLTFGAGDHHFAHQTLLEYCAARHITRDMQGRALRRLLAQWRSADPSYVGFVIDTASPAAQQEAMPQLYRLARRGGLRGCLFLAELARLGTGLSGAVLDAVTQGLSDAARNSAKAEHLRTRAVLALTGLPGPEVQVSLHRLVQSGALSGTPLVAAIAELLELGDPQVREMLHNLAMSEAQNSSQRLWAADHLAVFGDPRLADVLYALALSSRAQGASRMAAAQRLANLRDLRVPDAYHAISICPTVKSTHRFASAVELVTLGDDRVPDVLYRLAEDRKIEPPARQWAARQLVESADSRISGLLLRLARDHDLGQNFRRWAAGRLTAQGHPELPDVLYDLACDPQFDGRARVRMAWHLARTGDPRGRDLLRTLALTDPSSLAPHALEDEDSRAGAASALAALGSPDASEIIVELVEDANRTPFDRRNSVRQLADLPDSRAADALHSLALDVGLHPSLRAEAAFEIADLHDPRATDLLCTLVCDTTVPQHMRAFVVLRLCEHPDDRVPGVLRDLATRETLDIVCRSRAIASLANRNEVCVPDLLFNVAANPDVTESVRSMAAKALTTRDDIRAPELLHALVTDPALSQATRNAAMAWLGRSLLPQAHALLRELASSPSLDSGHRYLAVRTLADHNSPAASELLVALALDGDALPRDRSAAIHNLISQGDLRGPDLLRSLAQDPSVDDEHRFEAAEELMELRDPHSSDLLHELALDTKLRSFTRRAAVRELARHHDPRLPTLLRTLAEDPTLDDASRLSVVRRLAIICERDPELPP
ncbi:hypothetical protein OG866_00340 [Streptomyces sp. NBC_00663]|uniref:hypothetical protein n=1 Tax=Streptomyces sp. NBC_00663 TaxID=2975801 RepID=UPI002E3725D6|nr:hypothetical protein [Streptomyces sp. NBC_00663]